MSASNSRVLEQTGDSVRRSGNINLNPTTFSNKSTTGSVIAYAPDGLPLYPLADEEQSRQRRIAAVIIVIGIVAALAISIVGWILMKQSREEKLITGMGR